MARKDFAKGSGKSSVGGVRARASSARALHLSAESSGKVPVYVFGWPSFLGGADTKLAHLLVLLHDDFALTVVPNDRFRLEDKKWVPFLKRLGIEYSSLAQLPKKLEGFGLSLCNRRFFSRRIAHRAK